jgi:putative transcriptional regulator
MTRVTKVRAKATLQEKTRTEGRVSEKLPAHGRSSVAAEILEALEEVRDALKSGVSLEQRFTVRSYRFQLAARDYRPDDVRSVRRILGLSQPLFAEFLGVDASTVRSWEQGTRPPSSMARRFMDEISADPDYWRGRLRKTIFEA